VNIFFQRFDYGAALKVERKMSHLNIAFDRYASVGTVFHYIFTTAHHKFRKIRSFLHQSVDVCV